jgi:DNA transposition AAA+ family ATPase
MNAIEIRKAILMAGTTQAALARHLGVGATTVNRVISGKGRCAAVEAEIEKLLGRKIFGPRRKPGRPASVWVNVSNSKAQQNTSTNGVAA